MPGAELENFSIGATYCQAAQVASDPAGRPENAPFRVPWREAWGRVHGQAMPSELGTLANRTASPISMPCIPASPALISST